jgi:hypothetical protein
VRAAEIKSHEDSQKAIKGVIDEEQFKKLDASIPRAPAVSHFPDLPDKPKPTKE